MIDQQPVNSFNTALNNTFSEDLLNISNMSVNHKSMSSEMFDRFFVKFNMLAQDIEKIHRSHPHTISQDVLDKLNHLKRDTGILSTEIKNIDNRSADKISYLEQKCEELNDEICRLNDEVTNLLNVNSEMQQRLEDLGQRTSTDLAPTRSIGDKVNKSALYATEEKIEDLAGRNMDLRSQIDTLKQENNKCYTQAEWLRTTLDDHVKKYNEMLEEKLMLQDALDDLLREEHNGESIYLQLKKLQKQEVSVIYIERIHWQDK